jgi:hypothetical protein
MLDKPPGGSASRERTWMRMRAKNTYRARILVLATGFFIGEKGAGFRVLCVF